MSSPQGESGEYLTMVIWNSKIYMMEKDVFPSRKSELQVIPKDGKVAFRLKENGKFLRYYQTEKDLVADSNDLTRDALFSIETGSVRDVKERIVKIDFRNTADFTQVQPTVVQTKTIINKGSLPVEKTISMSWEASSKQSTSWEHNWALGVSAEGKVGASKGFASIEVSTSFSAEYGGANVQGDEETKTTSVEEDTKVVIPSNKRVEAELTVTKIDNAEVPFIAKIIRESDAGVTTFYQDGVWRGVLVLNSFVTVKEEDAD